MIERVYFYESALLRVGKGIFVSREWSIFVRVKCEMLDLYISQSANNLKQYV